MSVPLIATFMGAHELVVLTEFPSENGAICSIFSAALVGLFKHLALVNVFVLSIFCVFALLLMVCNCLFDLILSRFHFGEIT